MIYIRPWIAFTLYAALPIITVFLLNVLIIYRLVKVKRAAKKQVGPMPASSTPGKTTVQEKRKKASSMNAMFLSVSIVFLILLTPAILHYATSAYWVKTPGQQATSTLITAIFETLSYANHSVNFFVYCLTGKRFRREFLALLRFKKRHQVQGASATATCVS